MVRKFMYLRDFKQKLLFMKYKLFLILIIGLLIEPSIAKLNSKKNQKNLFQVKMITDSIVNYKLDKSHIFKFKFYYSDSTDGPLCLVKIKIYSNDSLIQTIVTKKVILGSIKQQLIDYNFDGYKDISVRYNCGSGGCAYWIWKYNKTDKKYHYAKEISEMLGLNIDEPNKNIVFNYRGGFEEQHWSTYKYVDDKLIFVKGLLEKRAVSSDTIFIEKVYKRKVNGKYVYNTENTFELKH